MIALIRASAACLAFVLQPLRASAQELTPGAYWPLPTGINVLTFVNSFNRGDVTFDPALTAEDARASIDTVALAYTRTLSIAGRSANVGLQLPVLGGHWKVCILVCQPNATGSASAIRACRWASTCTVPQP